MVQGIRTRCCALNVGYVFVIPSFLPYLLIFFNILLICPVLSPSELNSGTNDSKEKNWSKKLYHKDLEDLVREYISLPSNPEIFILIQPRVLKTKLCHKMTIQRDIVINEVPEIIRKVAKLTDTHVLDLSQIYVNKTEGGDIIISHSHI